jgi:hypothetical protein
VLGGEVEPDVDAHPARLIAKTVAITFAKQTNLQAEIQLFMITSVITLLLMVSGTL